MNSKKENLVNQPAGNNDDDKTIRHFCSFEEMEEDQLKYFASLTPEQLLMNLRKLILMSYGIKDESIFKNIPPIINLNSK